MAALSRSRAAADYFLVSPGINGAELGRTDVIGLFSGFGRDIYSCPANFEIRNIVLRQKSIADIRHDQLVYLVLFDLGGGNAVRAVELKLAVDLGTVYHVGSGGGDNGRFVVAHKTGKHRSIVILHQNHGTQQLVYLIGKARQALDKSALFV